MKKRGLGKGLGALLGDDIVNTESESRSGKYIDIKDIKANPFQPRVNFDDDAINALADSIRQHGIIQPIAVRLTKSANDDFYEIVAGERRYRAAVLVGLSEVPVVVLDVDDHDSAILALIENLQREDLNVIEKAKGVERLIQDFDLTHESCGKVLGLSRSSISNTLRLLELSDVVQEAIKEKKIDMGHARALLGVEKEEQYAFLQKITLNGLSVRETEALVRGEKKDAPAKKNKENKSRELSQQESVLSEIFNTKASITKRANGAGKITLAFSNKNDFEQLLKRLNS
ncbi:MAG: ParB/RepB/Spo0J family partition protein [Gammaproteobacteria bacterium]|nr:ParB/RepB/Spo0J family partition protein [Gammaproteobacteria bacterium]